jgi:hypothetical protein
VSQHASLSVNYGSEVTSETAIQLLRTAYNESKHLAKATCVNSYRGGPLLYTNPPGVFLNRLELKKQMRYFFCAKIFCVLQKMFWGKSSA